MERGHIDITTVLQATAGNISICMQYCLSLLAQFMEDYSERLEARPIEHGIMHA
jgi:hypothetical protein